MALFICGTYDSTDFQRILPARQAGQPVPIYQELFMDLETPLSFFKRLERDRYSFLLESVEGSERWARYSFLGTRPQRIFKARGQQIEIVEQRKIEKLIQRCAVESSWKSSLKDYRPVPCRRGAAVFWRRSRLCLLRRRRTVSRNRQPQERSFGHAGDFFSFRADPGRIRQPKAHDQSNR